jgi:hypothetical protein
MVKLTLANCAGAAATIAMWIVTATVSERLEPHFGDEVGGFVLLVGGFFGMWLYGPVSTKVAD